MQKTFIIAAAVSIAFSTARAGEIPNTAASPKTASKKHHGSAKKAASRDEASPIGGNASNPPSIGHTLADSLAPPLIPVVSFVNDHGLLAKDGTLTFNGITVYGGIDLGIGYQSHGAPLSSVFGPGRNYVPNVANSHTQLGFMPNGLSNSNIGIKGVEPIGGGLSLVFNVATSFLPTSGRLANGNLSLIQNNGLPASARTSGTPSSRDGQIDNLLGYAGVSSPTFGTLTYGRQYSLGLDAVIAYDPAGASSAFSLIGFSSMTAAGGNTEDARLDNSLKYRVNLGPFRAAAMYQFQNLGNDNRNGYAAQFGGEYRGFSADVIYSVVKDSVTASSETAAQTLLSPNTLDGTVSDNYAVMAVASYTLHQFKFYVGYENIRFENPEHPLPNGSPSDGYSLNPYANGVNNTAFTKNRVVDVFWGGIKYALRNNLDLIGAYYHYNQNSYATGVNSGCSSRFVAVSCSGTQDAGSILVDYRFSKNYDIYGGAMYGIVHGGFANGYAPSATTAGAATNTIDPTVGFRFQF